MTATALRDDALVSTPAGFSLRVGLPWIRSLPLASLTDLSVSVDGEAVSGLVVDVGGRSVSPEALSDESGWWFLQDRIALHSEGLLAGGPHEVAVGFRLVIPYLQAGPDAPVVLPFHLSRTLLLDAAASGPAAQVTGVREPAPQPVPGDLPDGWTLAASAFNWTPHVLLAEKPAADIAVGIVADGIASVIELEPGQLWRSFPAPADAEADRLRQALARVDGSVSISGASLDDWRSPTRRLDDAERLAFLLPQLRAARHVGAQGVRLPLGQAGEALLREVLPFLHELDLVLYEEIQGPQTPDAPATASAIDAIAHLDDPRVRILVDISMLMPSLPPSYLDTLRDGGVPEHLLARLATEWADPATSHAVADALRSGSVPPQIHTLYMNLLVRFGRSRASDLRGILPLIGAFHLKFWDLDDGDARLTQPIRELAAELRTTDFTGTLCSEWGGHEWVDADPSDITRGHLALASAALNAGG